MIVQKGGTFAVKRRTSSRLRAKARRASKARRRRRVAHRTAGWARGLRLATGVSGLIGAVGAPLLRLLAERSGLRAGLSAGNASKPPAPTYPATTTHVWTPSTATTPASKP